MTMDCQQPRKSIEALGNPPLRWDLCRRRNLPGQYSGAILETDTLMRALAVSSVLQDYYLQQDRLLDYVDCAYWRTSRTRWRPLAVLANDGVRVFFVDIGFLWYITNAYIFRLALPFDRSAMNHTMSIKAKSSWTVLALVHTKLLGTAVHSSRREGYDPNPVAESLSLLSLREYQLRLFESVEVKQSGMPCCDRIYRKHAEMSYAAFGSSEAH
ncbi:hypothetical protein BS47DRAFT_1383365 [Hydnum rufescens UP504]|uniref:Uncharacterized protein n=1 Tax=Hydnum rufescens UP504 TaxID=1448309 RepID=A0A9P6ATB4_9AGAM|nr:hypothetical protein BS47DRAFT_1383365 [Hydnum rufescens UP504]